MHEETDGSESQPRAASRIVASRSVDVAEVEAGTAPKLCGYLTKLSGKGPLRGYKPRWFVYDPRKCYLYYFKTPQDALPLGHIEIGDACFSYDVEAEEGQFAIYTGGKEFLLKVRAPPMVSVLPWVVCRHTHSLFPDSFLYFTFMTQIVLLNRIRHVCWSPQKVK